MFGKRRRRREHPLWGAIELAPFSFLVACIVEITFHTESMSDRQTLYYKRLFPFGP